MEQLAEMITNDKTPNKSATKEAFDRHGIEINNIVRKLDVDKTDNIISAAEIKQYWTLYNDWGEDLGEDVDEIDKAIKLLKQCDLFTCANGEEWWKAKCCLYTEEEELAGGKTKMEQLAEMITNDKTPNKSATKEAFDRHGIEINNIVRKLDVDKTDNIISAAEIKQYWTLYNDWGEDLGEDVDEIDKAIKLLKQCDLFTCANGEEWWKAKCCLYTEEEELAGVECKDEHSSCGEYADNCEKVNWEYMQDSCKKTCGLCSAAADKGTWTLRTEGTSCDERPQKYFNGVSKAKCQTSCQNENKEFKFAQHFEDNFCACFKTCAFNKKNKDAKVYGYGEVKKCTRCSCKSFDKPTKTYSRCSPVPKNSKCSGGYCAKCKSDGTTPMPGNYLKHTAECKNYESGSLSSETEVGKLQRLMDLLEAMEA